MTEEEQASIREWAESRVINRSQKTRPVADVIAEARKKTMTKADELKALADRCEREEPSAELNGRIFEAVYPGMICRAGVRLDYTESLDAAVSLIPADLALTWNLVTGGSQGTMTYVEMFISDEFHWCDSQADTPALALCAAALRARAALLTDGAAPASPKVRTPKEAF